METFGNRVRARRKELGLTQGQLATAAGLSQTTISDIERGRNDGSSEIVALARALSDSPERLLEGRPGKAPEPSNVSVGPARKGAVPVISWVQAGDYMHAVDLLQPGEAYEWVETGAAVREHTFALRVRGDSMEPDFPAGMILIVEPEMDVQPGDYVIAKNGDGEATFKQLVRDGEDWYLKPINPRYPIKPLGHSRIIGVVREAVRKLR